MLTGFRPARQRARPPISTRYRQVAGGFIVLCAVVALVGHTDKATRLIAVIAIVGIAYSLAGISAAAELAEAADDRMARIEVLLARIADAVAPAHNDPAAAEPQTARGTARDDDASEVATLPAAAPTVPPDQPDG